MTRGDQQTISPLTAAAHDLKTPLVLVKGLSWSLLDGQDRLSGMQREYLERIALSSERMLHTVQGLVDAYRVEQAQFQLELEPVNVRHIFEDVAQELQPYSQKLDCQIQVQVTRQTHLVVANKLFLASALYNLIDNALKHSQGSQVVLSGYIRQQHTRLAVHNDGPELSRKDFLQLERRLGGEPQPMRALAGTSGIGLYIVRQLVDAMGGRVGLNRAQNGTSLYIDLMTSGQLSLI